MVRQRSSRSVAGCIRRRICQLAEFCAAASRKPVVIGESLGGLVALSLARMRPTEYGMSSCSIRRSISPARIRRPGSASLAKQRQPALSTSDLHGDHGVRSSRLACGAHDAAPPHGAGGAVQLSAHRGRRPADFGCRLGRHGRRHRRVADGKSSVGSQRVPGTGHAILLDNPDGARAALQTYIVQPNDQLMTPTP